MTPWTRLLRPLGAAFAAACLVLAGGSGRFALANGVGDLYVANGSAVLEVHLIEQRTVETITVAPKPAALMFAADGQTLYTSDGTSRVGSINIADLTSAGTYTAPGLVTAMAYPAGSALYVAVSGSTTIYYRNSVSPSLIAGPVLAKVPTLLASSPYDPSLVAAAKGAPWLTIIKPASATITQAGGANGIGGKVAAMAVARGEGYVWVATTGPDRVAKVDLSTGHVVSSATLPGTPTAIAAEGHFAVVSIGSTLYRVQGTSAKKWATAPGGVLALASDLEASYLYVATAGKVVALDVTNPTATPASSVPMTNGAPTALAAVPNKASSLAGSAAANPSAGANADPAGAVGTARPRHTHAPATDTVSDLAGGGSATDPLTVLLGLAATVVAVALGSRYLIKRLVGA